MNDAPDGYRLTGSLAPRVSRLLHSVHTTLLFGCARPDAIYGRRGTVGGRWRACGTSLDDGPSSFFLFLPFHPSVKRRAYRIERGSRTDSTPKPVNSTSASTFGLLALLNSHRYCNHVDVRPCCRVSPNSKLLNRHDSLFFKFLGVRLLSLSLPMFLFYTSPPDEYGELPV